MPQIATDPNTGQTFTIPDFDPTQFDLSTFNPLSPSPSTINMPVPSGVIHMPWGDLDPSEDAGAWNAAHPGNPRPNSDFYTPEHKAALDKFNSTDPLYNFVNSGPTLANALTKVALLTGGSILGGMGLNALAGAGAGAGAAGAGAGAAGAAGGAGTAGALGGASTFAALPGTVEGLTITAPALASGISFPALAATGAGLAGTGALLGAGGGGAGATTVDPLTITAPAPSALVDPSLLVTGGGIGALQGATGGLGGGPDQMPPTDVEGLTVTAPSPTPDPSGLVPLPLLTTVPTDLTPTSTPATGPVDSTNPLSTIPVSLLDAIKSGDPSKIGSWIASNPLKAAELGLIAASAVGAGTSGGGSQPSGAFQPLTLPGTFSATSPKFQLAGRGDARVMPTQDWTKYGQGPEQSFFTGITQPAPIRNLMVDEPQGSYAVSRGYSHGGYAVKGPGDGRSDSINARLSDGEYVMDAETVSMLGDGSNKAGADKLDQFRVNLRKDKGRNLARGEFSAKARSPDAYMGGR